MKRTPQYIAVLVIALLIASWAISGLVRSVIRPSIGGDAEAYAELCIAAQSGQYAEIERGASKAYSMASDPELRKMSGFLVRYARFAQRAGITTTEEAGSFSGFGKSFLTGFLNPLHGLEGLTMTVELLWNDYEAIGARLDENYLPIFERYEFAGTCGTVVWWICIIGGTWAYFGLRDEFEPQLLEALAPVSFLGLAESPTLIGNLTAEQDGGEELASRSELNRKEDFETSP